MDYVKIPQLQLYPLSSLQDEDLFEICFFTGTSYVSRRIPGSVIKASAGSAQWGNITGNINFQTDLINILNDKLDIPTGSSSDYIDGTGAVVPFPSIPAAQVNSDWDATSGVAQILNKPTLAAVATSGDYDDLSNLPTIPAAQVNSDWDATSGVAEILNKPTIPAAQVNSDWDATSGVAQILNKPTGLPPSGSAGGDLTGSYPNPTVTAIHGIDVQNGTPADNQILQYTTSGSKWKHADLNATSVGLGNVANLAPADLPISDATQTALNLKADLASPVFTGIPEAPNPPSNSDSTQIATTAWVQDLITPVTNPNIPPVRGTEIRRGWISLNGSTTIGTLGAVSNSFTGSVTAVTATATSSVNAPRIRLITTTGSTNSRAGAIIDSGLGFTNIEAGFRFTCLFSPTDVSAGGTEWVVPGARQFVGLANSTALLPISSIVSVAQQSNIFGVGSDTDDNNLQVFFNDATGQATKIDLGNGFPKGKTLALPFPSMYLVELYLATNATTAYYRVTNLFNDAVAQGSINTNLPTAPINTIPQVVRTSGSTSQNISIDIGYLTLSSLF